MGVATGIFQYSNGSPAANASWQWKLSGDAILFSGTAACVAPPLISGVCDANGNMTATFAFNDVLSTTAGLSTTYQLTIKANNGGQIWDETYFLTGTAANINTIPPGGTPIQTVTTTTTVGGGFLQTATGAAGFWGPGYDVQTGFVQQGLQNFSQAANSIVVVPFNLNTGNVIRKVSFFSSNGVATSTSTQIWGFSVWDTLLATKLMDSGPMTFSTGAASTQAIGPVTVSAGAYVFAQTCNATVSATGICVIPTQGPIFQTGNLNKARFGLAASSAANGVFPASLGTITPFTAAAACPIFLPFFET